MRKWLAGIFVLAAVVASTQLHASRALADEVPLQFTGRLVAEFLDDGRKVRLLENYTYVDPAGVVWKVPKGTVVDGASIPRPFWSVIGGPFEGKYRNASVVHDFYCETKDRDWKSVHRMFYDAMLESKVERTRANVMYYAVYYFGPRWETALVRTVSLSCPAEPETARCVAEIHEQPQVVVLPPREIDEAVMEADINRIIVEELSIEQIERMRP
jgi:hypothetical protein